MGAGNIDDEVVAEARELEEAFIAVHRTVAALRAEAERGCDTVLTTFLVRRLEAREDQLAGALDALVESVTSLPRAAGLRKDVAGTEENPR